MRVVPITAADDKADMLEVLDSLRSSIESGELVAFAAVGIEPGDETRMWFASRQNVTRLRALGAIANLQHWFAAGE